MNKEEDTKETVEQATHYLECRHCIGRSCVDYVMKCIPLGKTRSGKLKIILFGDRNWKNKGNIKHIRYVDEDRVHIITNLTQDTNPKE